MFTAPLEQVRSQARELRFLPRVSWSRQGMVCRRREQGAEIGFTYRVVEGGQPTQSPPRATGTRRAGVRDQVLSLVTANPGITRSALIAEMNIKGDKSAEQSLSNALAALKKGGQIDNPDGNYKAL